MGLSCTLCTLAPYYVRVTASDSGICCRVPLTPLAFTPLLMLVLLVLSVRLLDYFPGGRTRELGDCQYAVVHLTQPDAEEGSQVAAV